MVMNLGFLSLINYQRAGEDDANILTEEHTDASTSLTTKTSFRNCMTKESLGGKMNPAMMREYLLQQYPNTYSLPGETETKQQINALVQSEKL